MLIVCLKVLLHGIFSNRVPASSFVSHRMARGRCGNDPLVVHTNHALVQKTDISRRKSVLRVVVP